MLIPKILLRLFKRAICIDSAPMEFSLAMQALFFGMFLLLPMNSFAAAQVYNLLALIMPEGMWGVLFIAIGTLEIVALGNRVGVLRSASVALALFLWLTVDLSSWLSNANSAATISYLTFAMMAMWSAISVSAKDYISCEH